MKRSIPSFWIIAWVATSSIADADVLFLKGGQRIEGEMVLKGGAYEVRTPYGVLSVPKAEVAKAVRPAEAFEAEAAKHEQTT